MDNNNQQQPISSQVPEQPSALLYQTPSRKKLSRGTLWGIIGGSIGLVVVVVAVILAIVFLGGPSKEDYKDLVSMINGFDRSAVSGGTGSDPDDYKKNLDKTIEKVDEYHKKIDSHKAQIGRAHV